MKQIGRSAIRPKIARDWSECRYCEKPILTSANSFPSNDNYADAMRGLINHGKRRKPVIRGKSDFFQS